MTCAEGQAQGGLFSGQLFDIAIRNVDAQKHYVSAIEWTTKSTNVRSFAGGTWRER